MRLRAEFTTEPFDVEGEPPEHVRAALEAAEAAGLVTDFGPFGTTLAGAEEAVHEAVGAVLRAAFAHGATRVTMQVEQTDG